MSEIFYSLFDEYRCRLMYRDGVPLSSWQRVKHKFDLSESEMETLTKDVLEFLNEFDIFNPLKKNKKVQLASEQYDFPLISKLVLEKNVRTHDAILISTASGTGCDYFITGDRTLRKTKVEGIELESPQSFLEKLLKSYKLGDATKPLILRPDLSKSEIESIPPIPSTFKLVKDGKNQKQNKSSNKKFKLVPVHKFGKKI